jgi:hypothetical protein
MKQIFNLSNFAALLILAVLAVVCCAPEVAFSAEGGITTAMAVPLVDTRPVYVKKLVEYFRENPLPTRFLRSFFTTKTTMAREISIEVRRGTERVAVDVIRGTHGNYNKMTKSTEKIFLPPYYNEYTVLNDTDLYDQAIASPTPASMAKLIAANGEDMLLLRDKIERAYELQCAQVLQSGIITLVNGTNIDFGRKAGSIVDLMASNYWADTGVDAATSIIAGCKWLRENGKVQGGTFNMICGEEAVADLLANEPVQKRADIRRFDLDDVRAPQRNAVGGVLHGQISAGSYRVNIWSYPEVYEDSSGNKVNYIDAKNAILLPLTPNFVLSFAAVPQLIRGGQVPQQGEYLFQDYMDDREGVHEGRIKSAGVAIPVGVDQIYTMQVVAS